MRFFWVSVALCDYILYFLEENISSVLVRHLIRPLNNIVAVFALH